MIEQNLTAQEQDWINLTNTIEELIEDVKAQSGGVLSIVIKKDFENMVAKLEVIANHDISDTTIIQRILKLIRKLLELL